VGYENGVHVPLHHLPSHKALDITRPIRLELIHKSRHTTNQEYFKVCEFCSGRRNHLKQNCKGNPKVEGVAKPRTHERVKAPSATVAPAEEASPTSSTTPANQAVPPAGTPPARPLPLRRPPTLWRRTRGTPSPIPATPT
jgi:hypothetical protein